MDRDISESTDESHFVERKNHSQRYVKIGNCQFRLRALTTILRSHIRAAPPLQIPYRISW
jgi:hypothetical protein